MKRSLLLAAVGVALAFPATASAAPTVAASAVPGVPQDCQAGCIQSLRLQCAATDPLAVRVTVSCWTRDSYRLTSFQNLPAAFVSGTVLGPILSYTLCVEGTARYANGTTATTRRCAPGDAVGAVVG